MSQVTKLVLFQHKVPSKDNLKFIYDVGSWER